MDALRGEGMVTRRRARLIDKRGRPVMGGGPKMRKRRRRERPLTVHERFALTLAVTRIMAATLEGMLHGGRGHCLSCARLASLDPVRISCAKPKCRCHALPKAGRRS